MTPRLALVLIAALSVSACSKDETPETVTPPAPAATTPTDAAASAPPSDLPPGSIGPVADLGGLEAGVQYTLVEGGQPLEPLDGKVEVVEVFSYVCGACAAFQPLVNAWKPTLGPDVKFSYVPASFRDTWAPYVRAYYTAEAMGVADKAHDAVFNAIHVERTLQGERAVDTAQAIGAVYAKHGVDGAAFASTMESFAITAKANRGAQFVQRNQVSSTPTMIIDGRYVAVGKTYEDVLRNTDLLIGRARAARQTMAPAPAVEAPAPGAEPAAATPSATP